MSSPNSVLARTANPFWVAAGTTLLVTALAYGLPRSYGATGVGLGFLLATHLLVLRGDDGAEARRYGVALGGLMEPEPIVWRRVLRESTRALGWTLLCAAAIFPPFWLGFLAWFGPRAGFAPSTLLRVLEQEGLGQLLVVALPEEAFYRGYLQTALEERWPSKHKLFGAPMGPAVLVTSVIFAVGHVLTRPNPERLGVFFPSLLFGWLRARTGGIGAAVLLHAASNLLVRWLEYGYGVR